MHKTWLAPTLIVAAFSLLAALLAPMMATAQTNGGWSAPRTVFFPQTGQTLDEVFLDQWRQNGGANAYGYPITPEITEKDGHIVQYLQYARFEWWPNGDKAENGANFVLAKIGEELKPGYQPASTAPATKKGFTSPKGLPKADELDAILAAWQPVKAPSKQADNIQYVDATKHTVSNGFLTFWQNSGGANYLGNPLTQEYIDKGVTYQVFEYGQLAWQKGKDPWLVPVGKVLADKYKLDQKPRAQGDVPTYDEALFTPPPTPTPTQAPQIADNGNGQGGNSGMAGKWIDVNLSTQYMVAYDGNSVFIESYVSTGRPGFDTPTGTFYINSKLESQTMEGVIGGEYYNVPDVPWVMYFTDEGHALHGTYWHNNFGQVMSHGCVNLPMDVAQALYFWAPIGTPVVIHY